jgi:hypothetical protein
MAQKESATAQQVITLRLADISILEKTEPSATGLINIIEGLVQIHSAKKWITKTNNISDVDGRGSLKNTSDFIEFSPHTEDAATKVVTLTNI